MKHLFYSLRPRQWIKNLFIFLPLIFGKRLLEAPIALKTFAAFILFSLAASSVYLFNDILDIKKDKEHAIKRLRPIASGRVSIKQASVASGILSIISIGFSFLLNTCFGFVVLVYIMFNMLYTKLLKNIVLIDLFCISFFFLLRIIAGTSIVRVEFSYWMIFMTVLLALFLGSVKRRQEIVVLKKRAATHRKVLVKYDTYFIDQMINVIASSIVVVYMLYTIDGRTVSLFGSNHLIFTIPFVYYGIFRYLYLIHKVYKDGDPTRMILFDRPMQLNLAMWVISCIAIVYLRL